MPKEKTSTDIRTARQESTVLLIKSIFADRARVTFPYIGEVEIEGPIQIRMYPHRQTTANIKRLDEWAEFGRTADALVAHMDHVKDRLKAELTLEKQARADAERQLADAKKEMTDIEKTDEPKVYPIVSEVWRCNGCYIYNKTTRGFCAECGKKWIKDDCEIYTKTTSKFGLSSLQLKHPVTPSEETQLPE